MNIVEISNTEACNVVFISFLIITAIANSRGVEGAAAVGIGEKIISFLFLVPSGMLSAVGPLAAPDAGGGRSHTPPCAIRA